MDDSGWQDAKSGTACPANVAEPKEARLLVPQARPRLIWARS